MAGEFAGRVLKTTAGIMSAIDPKSTMKYLGKSHNELMKSKSYAFGRKSADFFSDGIVGSVKAMKGTGADGAKHGLVKGLVKGHSKTITDAETAAKMGKNIGDEVLSGKKMLGTAAAITAGGRIISGGGLYKDKNGNTNVPILPFI